MNKLLHLWEDLRTSLWFVPTLLVSGAVVLAVALVEVSSSVNGERLAERWPRLFGVGAEGARAMLSAIASSMITVAGVTFSITVVTLALASSQYTSRILRNFMRDRANQTVLGIFVGVFAYCLVVLRTIRGGDEEGVFVPALGARRRAASVRGHRLPDLLHSSHCGLDSGDEHAGETLQAVDRLFPADVGEAAVEHGSDGQEVGLAAQTWVTIPARKTGYIQAVDADALFNLAREHGTVVRMERGIGEFVIEASPSRPWPESNKTKSPFGS